MFKIRKTAALAALFCSSVLNAWASADHMVIAMPQIPTIIEPQGINNNAIDRYVGNVFETLLKADQKTGELKPGLAESWCRLSPDTVEFKLRSGVRFHDGTPLTADDVVFTFGPERFSGEKAPGRAVAWEFLGNLKEVVKVDDLTVRVTMKAPDPMIERRFSARTSEIISEDGWKAAGGWEKWLKAPVGTGPYRIASFKTGNRLELTRFDGYWGKTAPAAKVSFVEVPELSARVAGLRSGEFDLITEVPPDQVKPLSADGRIDVTGADGVFFGFDLEHVLRHRREDGLLLVPTMGERLGAAGKTMRVYCANSKGSTRLQHLYADRYPDHVCACVHDLVTSVPDNERRELVEDFGPGVPLEFPDFRGTKLVVDLFFERELPRGLGDVTVLWIGEPDHSSHEFGIDDERTREARRDADRQFARMLEWWETEGRNAGVQLVVMSDHGHGVVRRHFDMKGILEKAGLSILMGREVLEGADTASADAVLVGTYCAGLWFTNPADLSLQLRARDALMTSPDIGLLFSPSDPEQPCSIEGRIPGTFSERLVFTDGRRSPDLRIVPRGDPETGGLVMAPELPLGAGNHGGLLPQEINAVLAVGGSAFPGSAVHDDPAGHADLAVTIMTLEGLLSDSDMVKPTGRLLDEALPGGPVRRTPAGEAFDLTFGAFHQRIERLSSGGRAYVTCAHRINNDGWTPERGLPEGARTDDDD